MAIALLLLGGFWQVQWLQLAGVILLGHSSLDRVFGYGLKHTASFHLTHLGRIGRESAE